MEENICIVCGKVMVDGKCNNCGRTIEGELTDSIATAYSALNKKDFTTAKKLFREYMSENPSSAEGYFGLFCAKFSFRYDNMIGATTLVPTYYESHDFRHDKDYLKALKLATDTVRAEYIAGVDHVVGVLDVWKSKMEKLPKYDIYLSYKESDETLGIERTSDSIEAQDLYVYLSSLGYSVFYARESLRGKSIMEREAYIYNAIDTAKIMIVYGQSVDYINDIDVSGDWSRYSKLISLGKKEKNSLMVAYEKVTEKDIQGIFGGDVTLIDAHKKSFLIDIRNAVNDRIVDTIPNGNNESIIDKHLKKLSIDTFNRKTNKVLGYVLLGSIGLSLVSLIVWFMMYYFVGLHKILSNVLNIILIVSVVTSITLSTILAFREGGNNFKYISFITCSIVGLGMAIFGLFSTNYIPDIIKKSNATYGNYIYRGYDYSYILDKDGKKDAIAIHGMDKFFEGVNWYVTVPKRILGYDVESFQIVSNSWVSSVTLNTSICKSVNIIDAKSLKEVNINTTKVLRDMSIESCPALHTIDVSNLQSIEGLRVVNCDSITSINVAIADTVKLEVKDCDNIENVYIPNVLGIDLTFESCAKLKSVAMPKVNKVTKLYYINCPMVDVIDFSVAHDMGHFKIDRCTGLTKIYFRQNIMVSGASMNFALANADYTMVFESRVILNILGSNNSYFTETVRAKFPAKVYISQTLIDSLGATSIYDKIAWLDTYTLGEDVVENNITYKVYNRG